MSVTAKAKASRKSSQTDLAEQDRSRSRLVETAIYRRARGYKVALKKTHKLKAVLINIKVMINSFTQVTCSHYNGGTPFVKS